MYFRQIFALAIKEFLALLRDKRSRLVIIGPPLAQLLVFGFAATYDLNNVAVAIYNEDRGGAARELVSRIEGSPNFEVVAYIDRDSEVAPLINNRDVLIVVHIGQNFSSDLIQGTTTPLQAILDGRNSNTAMIAMNYLRNIVQDYNLSWLASQGESGLLVTLQTRAWYNENLQSRWFIVPGIVGLLTLVVTLLVTCI